MLPAPRNTTKSPGFASSRTIGAMPPALDVARVAVAARADALHQRLGRDAFDRILARRIDRRDHHGVGVVEAGGKIVEQVAQAREAVRLRDGDDAALGRESRAAFSTALISTG
jgi:hypothetical protein